MTPAAAATDVRDYFAEIWRKRYFWASLVKMDLRARYRRSVLGIGWSLLNPIAMTAVMCVVFTRLFGQDLRTYAPYILSGMALWTFVLGVTVEGCRSFFQGEAYIRQQPAPLAIYPLRTTLSAAIHFGLALVVLLGFVWLLNGFGNLPALAILVPELMLLFMLGWATTVCVSIINVMFQDTQHLVHVGMQILFYATPVFYPAQLLRDHDLAWLVDYNPAAACLEMLREPILHGQMPSTAAVVTASIATVVMTILAAIGLAKMQRRLIFYL